MVRVGGGLSAILIPLQFLHNYEGFANIDKEVRRFKVQLQPKLTFFD